MNLLVNLGCEVPDDRNMLNEQLWSPDRPKFRGQKVKGKLISCEISGKFLLFIC